MKTIFYSVPGSDSFPILTPISIDAASRPTQIPQEDKVTAAWLKIEDSVGNNSARS
jgi:hypothetical protein